MNRVSIGFNIGGLGENEFALNCRHGHLWRIRFIYCEY